MSHVCISSWNVLECCPRRSASPGYVTRKELLQTLVGAGWTAPDADRLYNHVCAAGSCGDRSLSIFLAEKSELGEIRRELHHDYPRGRQLRQVDPNEFYTDLKKVGAGASGTVYSATQKVSGQKVALK